MIDWPDFDIPGIPEKFSAELRRTQRVNLDLETRAPDGHPEKDAKNPRLAIPTLYSFTCGTYCGVFPPGDAAERVTRAILRCPFMFVATHNNLYDIIVLHERGIVRESEIRAQLIDVMVYQFLIDEEAEKGLKEMAWFYFKKQMLTYKEVTKTHAAALRIEAIDAEIAEWLKKIARFPKERPWPEFDSPGTKVRSKTSKMIDEVADARWPGKRNPETGRRSFSAEEREAREAFTSAHALRLEMAFGELAHLTFTSWAETEKIQPLREEREQKQEELRRAFLKYAQDDTIYDAKLWNKLEPIVRRGTKQNPPLDYWVDIEMAVRHISTLASCRGLPIDVARLQRLGTVLDPLIEEFDADVKNLSSGYAPKNGKEFNPNSTEQLRELLFDMLKLDPPMIRRAPDGRELPKFTPGGQKLIDQMEKERRAFPDLRDMKTITPEVRACLCSDSEVLERLTHPIAMAILNRRSLEKLKGTYVESAVARVLAEGGGRLRGIFNSIGTVTGRFSSSEPNLQNIPSRKKPDFYDERVLGLGPTIREAFVCEAGKDLIVADQSQVELRLIAHYTRDAALLEVYKEGIQIDGVFHYTGDIHARTAKKHGIPRKLAKNVNFGYMYGMRALRFARQVRLFIPGTKTYDVKLSNELRDIFFAEHPEIQAAHEDYEQLWYSDVCNYLMISGRVRHFPKNSYVTGGKILNAKIQGSSADIIKLNLLIIDRYVKPLVPSLELLFQVHDELGYQADKSESRLAATLIKFVMEYAWFPWLIVPILASAKVCRTWAAKDDDDIPEVGVYYACVAGEHKTFTEQTWHEYRAAEKAKLPITAKGATAMLSGADYAECVRLLDPDKIRKELRLPDQPIE